MNNDMHPSANANRKPVVKGILAVLISSFAGVVGSAFSAKAIPTWYDALAKPSFTPPNGVFAPVWTALYVIMGIAAALVWVKAFERRAEVRKALLLFGLQLALNALWSAVFFGLHSPLGGLIVIIALILAIVATMIAFYRISKPAMYLMIPYLAWVCFATALTFSIWRMN